MIKGIIELLNTFLNAKKNELYLFELYLKNNDRYSYDWKNTLKEKIINEIVKFYKDEISDEKLIKDYVKYITPEENKDLIINLQKELKLSGNQSY